MIAIALAHVLATSPEGVELRWDAPPQCPDAADFEDRVERYVEGSQRGEEPVRVDATIVRDGERWRLRLATSVGDEAEQVRELDDADCDGLAESAAVLVAIAVAPELAGVVPPPAEPELGPDAVESEPEPLPSTPTSSSSSSIVVDDEPPPPPAPVTHASLRVIGGASLGWLPPGGDVGLAVAVFWRWLRIEVSGVYSPRRQIRFADITDAGVDVSGWAVGVKVCHVFHPLVWLDTPVCAGGEAGQVIGDPVGLVDGRTGAPTWAAGVAAASLRFLVHSRIALWVSPELLVSITRPTLTLGNADTPIFEAAPVGGRFHGGIELRFW